MMMGVVSNKNRRLEIFIIQNINRNMLIGVMLYPENICKIREYFGHFQKENESPQVFILKVHHILMLKYHHKKYPVFIIQ